MTTATVTSKGQVTIPREVREEMNISANSKLDFIVLRNGKMIVRHKSQDVSDLFGVAKKVANARR